eukprot:m.150269 g.150269  ORF g.150269 m.150269 type:complete len:456 (+) comp30718_c3_seq1:151-1518(+)
MAPHRIIKLGLAAIGLVVVAALVTVNFGEPVDFARQTNEQDPVPSQNSAPSSVFDKHYVVTQDNTVIITYCISGPNEKDLAKKAILNTLKLKAETPHAEKDTTAAELEVSLKSVLSHLPPFGYALKIYFIVDTISSLNIREVLTRAELNGSSWPIPISVEVLDVSALENQMRWFIVNSAAFAAYKTFHGFGQWYRFFVPWILPESVKQTIYIDLDVWFVTSPVGVWLERDEKAMMQWGEKGKCSGIMILSTENMRKRFFQTTTNASCMELKHNGDISETIRDGRNGDQAALRKLNKWQPELFTYLSEAYDISIANGAWRHKDITKAFPTAGVLHSNGGGPDNFRPYFTKEFYDNSPKGWSLVKYYVELPWTWMLNQGAVAAAALVAAGLDHMAHKLEIKFEVVLPSAAFNASLAPYIRKHTVDCKHLCPNRKNEKEMGDKREYDLFLKCAECLCK